MRRRVMASVGKPLPYRRRLAYLEYDGNQFIDTKIIPENGYSFGATIYTMTVAGGQVAKFGINGNSGSNARFAFGLIGLNMAYFGLAQINLDSSIYGVDFNQWIEWSIDSRLRIGTVNGIEVNITNAYDLDANAKSVFLMVSNPPMSADKHRGRCSKAWVKDSNGNYVFNALPVMSYEDRPCLYDDVSGQLFYNQGTGEFTWGELGTELAGGGV